MKQEQYLLHYQIEMEHWWFQARRFIVHELIYHIVPPGQDHVIVDIGCGTGSNIISLAKEYSVHGIDTSIEAINYATSLGSHVPFHHTSESAPLDKNILESADIILLMDTLEHVSDDYAALSEIVNSISHRTYVLITVPADLELWSAHDESFGHFRRYSLERLQDTWSSLPVQTLLLSYYNARLYPIIKVIRKLNRLRGSSTGLAGTDFKTRNRIVNFILRTIFSGEIRVLLNLLSGRRNSMYSKGVSLIAILQRK